MKINCKTCGKAVEVNTAKYLNPENAEVICEECKDYCYKKCELQKNRVLSWHSEPCKSCKHNPYNKALKKGAEP